jgi:hypothetical protein
LVRNEAHAWVEVFDGLSWHRVDLGGAASHIDYEQHSSEHQHQPPTDPYQWPPGAESAQDLTAQASGSGTHAAPSTPNAPGSAAPAAHSPRAPTASASAANEPPPSRDDTRTQADVSLAAEEHELKRGAQLHVSGVARTDQSVCAFSRVDIALRDKTGSEHWLGALATDQSGKYDGRVALPFELEVGDYSVVASTPESAQCRINSR